MKIKFQKVAILISFILLFYACSSNPAASIQGVYEVNKERLKESLKNEMDGESVLAIGLLNVAIENAVIEFKINGDSINGILFMAGETTLLKSKIFERNDSLIFNTDTASAFLIPNDSGLSMLVEGADMILELDKTKKSELSNETKQAIESQKVVIKEKGEFEQNLGRWREGNYVDEFGDRTGTGFAYCIIRGTGENSISTKSEVYVKAMVDSDELWFEIYNSSFTLKETFPDSKFGIMKLKFPDGSVESEKVFFFENTVSESDENVILFDFISQNSGEVKVLIDLSTASDYYTDKYQFTIEKSNLMEILNRLRE